MSLLRAAAYTTATVGTAAGIAGCPAQEDVRASAQDFMCNAELPGLGADKGVGDIAFYRVISFNPRTVATNHQWDRRDNAQAEHTGLKGGLYCADAPGMIDPRYSARVVEGGFGEHGFRQDCGRAFFQPGEHGLVVDVTAKGLVPVAGSLTEFAWRESTERFVTTDTDSLPPERES